MKSFGRILLVPSLAVLLVPGGASSRPAPDVRVRREVRVPDIPGYRTLKVDLHTHTVFSDGSVWPDVRAEEAWREGLDAVAITDHIEYQPHAADLPTSHDRSFEIAKPHGDGLAVAVIRGSEVTRDMPPGHLNAVFLRTSKPLETSAWRDAVKAAHEQGAFIFWNHPGWTGQQPDGVAKWYPEHTELVEKGLLHGIEVVNEREYYPEAHRWCLEKDLAILANSDIHAPLNLDYHVHAGDHRPVTLVFAKDASQDSIKEALFARRTAAWADDRLIGKEELLRPVFERSIEVLTPRITLKPGAAAYVQVRNGSDVRYVLKGGGSEGGVSAPAQVFLTANRTSLVTVAAAEGAQPGTVRLVAPYEVENLLVEPGRGLRYELAVEVRVAAGEE